MSAHTGHSITVAWEQSSRPRSTGRLNHSQQAFASTFLWHQGRSRGKTKGIVQDSAEKSGMALGLGWPILI